MNHRHAETLRILENFASTYSADSENGRALRYAISALSGGGVMVPREATSKMMDRAVAAMHAAPVDWRGRQGHAAFRAGYAAALDAAIDAHAQGHTKGEPC